MRAAASALSPRTSTALITAFSAAGSFTPSVCNAKTASIFAPVSAPMLVMPEPSTSPRACNMVPAFSLSVSVICSQVFLPSPLILPSAALLSLAIMFKRSAGVLPLKIRCANLGPTPLTSSNMINVSFSVLSAKPKSVMESSRTTRFVCKTTSVPSSGSLPAV